MPAGARQHRRANVELPARVESPLAHLSRKLHSSMGFRRVEPNRHRDLDLDPDMEIQI